MRAIAPYLMFAMALWAAEPERKGLDNASFGGFVPLIIVGEGWSQQIMIKNVDDEEALTGTIKFFKADGSPWAVELRDRGTASEFFVTLFPGQMAVYETVVRTHPQVLGWAEIDTECCAYSHAQTIFRKQTPGRPDLMTSMVLGSDSIRRADIPFDNRDGKYAGVGVLVTESCYSFSCESTLRWRFKDPMGNIFKEATTKQAHQTLHWFSLTADHPETAGRLGSIEVSSGDADSEYVELVAFSLQFAPNGAFTVITPYER